MRSAFSATACSVGIQAGPYHQATLGRHIGPEPGDQLAPDLLGEPVSTLDRLRPAELGWHDRFGLRGAGLRGRDDMVLRHPVDHPVPPRFGGVRVTEWIVVVGCLRQRREEGGLGKVSFSSGLLK